MSPIRERLQPRLQFRHWGFGALLIASVLALVQLLLQPVPGHYRVFTSAGLSLWRGGSAYGSHFGTGVGIFLYSPTSALFFFAPFGALPERAGIVLYTALSWAAFVSGTLRLSRICHPAAKGASPTPFPAMNLFWFLIAPQIVSSIQNSKVELFMTGLLFWSTALLFEGRRQWLSAALLAMITNWKLQPTPTVGLLGLAWILNHKNAHWPIRFLICLAGWFILPLFVLSPSSLAQEYSTWWRDLERFSSEAFLTFENVYALFDRRLGIPMSLLRSQAILLASGAMLACVVFAWISRFRRKFAPSELFRTSILLALVLGAVFTVFFSPLGQNNALILYAPIPLCFLAFLERKHSKIPLRWTIFFLGLWALMALSYSDISPPMWHHLLRENVAKPIACFVLGLSYAALQFYSQQSPEDFDGRWNRG